MTASTLPAPLRPAVCRAIARQPGTARHAAVVRTLRARLLVPTLLIPALVPYNFVRTSTPVRYACVVPLVSAVCLLVLHLHRTRQDLATRLLLGGVVVAVAFAQLTDGSGAASALAVGPLLCGVAVTHSLDHRRLADVAWGLLVAGAAVCCLEFVTRTHLYSELWGQPLFLAWRGGEFRARAFAGHPVPAAMSAVVLAFVYWALRSKDRRAQRGRDAVSLLSVAAVLITTGTRSALLVLVVGLLLCAVLPKHGVLRHSPLRLPLLFILAGVVVYVTASTVGTLGNTDRLLSFDSLRGSDSYTVRASAVDVVRSLPQDDGWAGVLVGHGHRALQTVLMNGAGIGDLSTLDDQAVTLYYDYGIIGLTAGMVMLPLLALSTFWKGSVSVLGLPLLASVIGLFFFDGLYISTTAWATGLAFGLAHWRTEA